MERKPGPSSVMSRIIPVALTSLALVPMFFGAGAELRAPLAASVIGGLTSATLLTLLVVPALFMTISGRFVSHDASVEGGPRVEGTGAGGLTARGGTP